MNPSDDPTRSVPLRTPCSDKPAFQTLPISELYGLSKLPKSKRWAANWVALVIGLSCRGEFSMDFDSTLGYRPGSGFLLFFWIFFLGLVVVRSPVPSHGLFAAER